MPFLDITPAGPGTPPLFQGYQPMGGVFDEVKSQDPETGFLWQNFGRRLDQLGQDGLARAWRRGEDLLKENGLGHDLFPGRTASSRRWDLDPIPLLLGEGEWNLLAQGVIQRAKLFDAVLHDCYGAQTLIGNGIIPSRLVLGQRQFCRSLCQIVPPSERLLKFCAVDVARNASGHWAVVADRTEAPSGLGFALENRIVLSQVFPDTTKNLNLIRLASFFQEFSAMLHGLAPPAIDSPRVVMLSPGTDDKAYFEDAFLSRYLGLTMATGPELTVRNNRLYLKTVGGLERVHVLLRRLPGSVLDPLENAGEGIGGVPGLTQAIREKTVVVVNPPGTGILEAPAFFPYLPQINKFFGNSELILPSLSTASWEEGQEMLKGGAAVIKSAYDRSLFRPMMAGDLDEEALSRISAEAALHPDRYVIQEKMTCSTAPVWSEDGLESLPVAIRLFLFADGDQYRVMPGGLVRAAPTTDSVPGLSPGGDTSSKDLWVCSRSEHQQALLSNLPRQVAIRRSGEKLSSKAADNMYWIGRNSERAEFAVRTLLAIVEDVTSEQENQKLPAIPPLMRVLARMHYLPEEVALASTPELDRQKLLEDLAPVICRDHGQLNPPLESLPFSFSRLRDLAAFSRNRLSTESWRILRILDRKVEGKSPGSRSGLRALLQDILLHQSAFNGTCRENLTRNESWSFLNIGRRLERCLWLVTLAEEILGNHPALPSSVLDTVLAIVDCSLTYRYRYQGAPQVIPTFDLLLFDPDNPRSLAFQLAELDRSFSSLPKPRNGAIIRPGHAVIRRALVYLETEIMMVNEEVSRGATVGKVRHFVTRLTQELPEIHEQITWEFFTHASFTSS